MKRALLFALVAASAGVAVLAVAQAPTAADDARRAKVYARFGDVTITVGDLEDRIWGQSTFHPERFEDPERLGALADDALAFALLAHEAERRGYAERPAVKRAYEEALVQRFVREEFDERFARAEVSDEDVAAYYEAHRERYVVPDQVRASHILVATEDEARSLIAELRGADLRTARQRARERSLDTETKLSGGDLRFFTREGVPAGTHGAPVHPAIVEAAFRLRERGEVYGEPVPVDGKFSVVILTGLRPGQTQTVEEVAPGLRRRINQDRRREAIEALVQALRARAQVKTHPEKLRGIELDPPPSALSEPHAR
jgi:peptidyl-prolyl cis-trans isomerase C